MDVKQIKPITKIKTGKQATVIDIKGDEAVINQLESMGIVPGVILKKVSASFFHGPIILEKDFMQIALGYNMATQIFVKVLDEQSNGAKL